MAQNPPPHPVDDVDDLYEAMQKLMLDSQVIRSAHFIAAERKDRKAKIFLVLVILINLLITSGLIEIVFVNQAIDNAIKVLSFLAAAFAALQTFLNFQKEVECHRKSGGIYASIYHRTRLVMAEYQEQPASRLDLITAFKALSEEYLKANDDASVCVPKDADYDKARSRRDSIVAHETAGAVRH
jgi:hypothetical protein